MGLVKYRMWQRTPVRSKGRTVLEGNQCLVALSAELPEHSISVGVRLSEAHVHTVVSSGEPFILPPPR